MREGNPIQADTLRGAGYYGATEPTHKTKCRHSNNPAGHNPDCECQTHPQHVRASQVIPYADHPYEDCAANCPECREQAWWHQLKTEKNRERYR